MHQIRHFLTFLLQSESYSFKGKNPTFSIFLIFFYLRKPRKTYKKNPFFLVINKKMSTTLVDKKISIYL